MLLENVKRRPPFVTLLGEPGLGKTTLACMFPDAILIRLEDGVEAVPDQFKPALMPVVESVQDLEEQIRWVFGARKKHGKKTVILDSITRAETMFEREIVANDPNRPSSINQACGGFGAGPKALGALHSKIRKLLGHLNEKGDMTVIVIAHSSTETVEPPDSDNYTRHTLRLGKHSMAPWVDDVDMVGFIQLQKFVRGAKEATKSTAAKAGKAMSDGTRELVAYVTAGNVSKNRFGLPDGEPIELPNPNKPGAVNPLFALIPYFVENGYAKVEEKPKGKGKAAAKPAADDEMRDEEPQSKPDPEEEQDPATTVSDEIADDEPEL